MSDTTLSPAQDTGSDDLGATIAAAIEDQENTDIIGELASASDDPPDSPDTPEPEGDGSEAGEGADRTDEPDPPPPAAHQEADTGPERSADATPEHRQIAEAYQGAVAPYQAYLASKGVSAPQAVQILLAAEYQLSTGGPDQKAKIMAQLAKDYGVDLDALYDVEEAAPASPEIAQLQQRQAVLERMVNGERQQVVAQTRQAVEGQVAAFAGEKDAAGNLLHPHLQQLSNTMGQAIERDPDLTLEQAYENAVWGEPTLRQKALGKRRAAAGKPAKAKASAKPVKESSLTDDLREQYQIAVERAAS